MEQEEDRAGGWEASSPGYRAQALAKQCLQGWREEKLSILSVIHSLRRAGHSGDAGATQSHWVPHALLCTAWKETANLPKHLRPRNLNSNSERSVAALGSISSGLGRNYVRTECMQHKNLPSTHPPTAPPAGSGATVRWPLSTENIGEN